MSLRLFLVLLPAFAVGGYLIGSRLGPRAPAYSPRPRAAVKQDDERLQNARAAEGLDSLRRLAEEASGTPLGARAELALVRRTDGAAQRAAARQAFLERHPESWLRRTWGEQPSPESR